MLAQLRRVVRLAPFRGRQRVGGSFVAVARWTVRPGQEAEVGRVLRQLASASRRETGCITYSAHRSVDNPAEFLIYERYIDEDAFHRHVESQHFHALVLEDALPRLASRTRQTYTVLS